MELAKKKKREAHWLTILNINRKMPSSDYASTPHRNYLLILQNFHNGNNLSAARMQTYLTGGVEYACPRVEQVSSF